MGKEIRVAFAGLGNCTSSLTQGLFYYRDIKDDEFVPGLMHPVLGEYRLRDLVPVAAFDIDDDKVGKDMSKALFSGPNCTPTIAEVPNLGVEVMMGPVYDGAPDHLRQFFKVSDKKPVDVGKVLRDTKADVLVNFIPTGSNDAAWYYGRAAVENGVAFVNCMPTLVVSNDEFAEEARKMGSQLVGDDVKSQVGATILHRALVKLFMDRGLKVTKSYQLNVGGNTDFVNLSKRGEDKEVTKSAAVHSVLPYDFPLSTGFGFLPILKDTKIAFISLEGEKFGGAPIKLDVKLEVIDSPNSSGVIIDAIRCAKIARDRGVSGRLESASAYLMKHPPKQYPDAQARQMLEEFIEGKRER